MLLTIDAGNTNIVFAVFQEQECIAQKRCETHDDDFPELLYDISGVVISSVVPEIDDALAGYCRMHYGVAPKFVDHHSFDGLLDVKLALPEQAGADRLVNAFCARQDYGSPAVVIDFGTATTFDVIDGQGAYRGGVIAPGPHLSMKALHLATAKLPEVEIIKPGSVIGNDTVSAMQSGLFWGYVGMIEGTLHRIAEELKEKPFVIATGGLASLFADSVPAIEKVDKDLTLRGLLHIYQCRQKQMAAE